MEPTQNPSSDSTNSDTPEPAAPSGSVMKHELRLQPIAPSPETEPELTQAEVEPTSEPVVTPPSADAEQAPEAKQPTPEIAQMAAAMAAESKASPSTPSVIGAAVTPETSTITPATTQPVTDAASPSPVITPTANTIISADFAPGTGAGTPVAGVVSNEPVPPLKQPRSRAKPVLIAVIALIVLIGGVSAYYFGYYMNSSVVLSQSLANTGKGYDKLIAYSNAQQKNAYKGGTMTGTYSVKSGDASTDGNMSFKSDGANSDGTIDIGVGVTRVNLELRSIKAASSTTPDIYFKASGINGLGDLLGDASFGQTLDQLDNKWIVVDRSLIDNVKTQIQKQTNTAAAADMANVPTQAQIMSELTAFGETNKQYVFTANKNKAVATVVKTYGKETIDGHTLYHYQMALNKANVKSYITAQRDALKASGLNSWIVNNKYQSTVDDAYNSLQQSADNITPNDTFDMWSDVKTRLVYKIRVSDTKNPATNYVELGLNYTGGDSFPLFVAGQSNTENDGDTTFSVVANLNTKTNAVAVTFTAKQKSDDTTTITANLNVKPSNDALNITAPAGAEPVSQVLSSLGLTDVLNSYLNGSAASGLGTSSNTDDFTTFTQ